MIRSNGKIKSLVKNTCYEWILSSNIKENLKGSFNFKKWKTEIYSSDFAEIFTKEKGNYNKVILYYNI